MSSRLCFCILCKGRVLLSSYQIKQPVKIYGLGDAKSATGRSTAEKLRADEGDSSSESSSDRESEKEECSFTSAVVKGTSKSAAGPSVAKKSTKALQATRRVTGNRRRKTAVVLDLKVKVFDMLNISKTHAWSMKLQVKQVMVMLTLQSTVMILRTATW